MNNIVKILNRLTLILSGEQGIVLWEVGGVDQVVGGKYGFGGEIQGFGFWGGYFCKLFGQGDEGKSMGFGFGQLFEQQAANESYDGGKKEIKGDRYKDTGGRQKERHRSLGFGFCPFINITY